MISKGYSEQNSFPRITPRDAVSVEYKYDKTQYMYNVQLSTGCAANSCFPSDFYQILDNFSHQGLSPKHFAKGLKKELLPHRGWWTSVLY